MKKPKGLHNERMGKKIHRENGEGRDILLHDGRHDGIGRLFHVSYVFPDLLN